MPSSDQRILTDQSEEAIELERMMVKFVCMPEGPRKEAARRAIEMAKQTDKERKVQCVPPTH